MSLKLKAFPFGRPRRRLRAPDTTPGAAPRRTRRTGPRIACSAVVLAVGLSLLPGLATSSSAAPVTSRAAVPAVSAAVGPVATASPCRKKRSSKVRKACYRAERAAARARAAAAARARALAVAQARATRAKARASWKVAIRARVSADAMTPKRCRAYKSRRVEAKCFRDMKKRKKWATYTGKVYRTAAASYEGARVRAVSAVGRPRSSWVVPPGNYFSYPNRSRADQQAIRSRVITTINSTWGGPRDGALAWSGNGTIRIVTWTLNDWPTARALVAAHQRGVSVQVVAARHPNRGHAAWKWLKKRLGQRYFWPGVPGSSNQISFARECRGSCRGPGGTPHAKYFLFDKVGPRQTRNVVVQTSMNLTDMAYKGQWNQAQVLHSGPVYADFLNVFKQARIGRPTSVPYHVAALGNVVTYFFPRPRAQPAQDPVMQVLTGVRCLGTTAPGTRGRTKIRIIQYSMSGRRGVWIAKRLRALKAAGCNVAIIYADSSAPVMRVLRAKRSPGPIPMKQSVLTDRAGFVRSYNHSKWMAIWGAWGNNRSDALTLSGSANWSDAAFGNDEQMTLTRDVGTARSHIITFDRTWKQKSSRPVRRAARWPVQPE